MKTAKTPRRLSAKATQEAGQKIVKRRFFDLLSEQDIVATHEQFCQGELGSIENFQIESHLQAPTIADVAARLLKAGWVYVDGFENQTAPHLAGPDGDGIRINREKTFARLVYCPGTATKWVDSVKQTAMAIKTHTNQQVCLPVGMNMLELAAIEKG